jgi:hypothetical protein
MSAVLFLPAITVGLFNRVLGADDASFGPVMGKRGADGAASERVGASPRVRSAASSTGKSTWIH